MRVHVLRRCVTKLRWAWPRRKCATVWHRCVLTIVAVPTVHVCSLSGNKIDEAGCSMLAEALAVNSTLQALQ